MERTNILQDFFESLSENNDLLESVNKEKLERGFQTFITNDRGELSVLDSVNEMCLESLSPETFEKWEEVKNELKQNRRLLKKFNYV